MKCSCLLLAFILSTPLMAFDKDLKTTSDRIPLEFNLLFESMKLEIKSPKEKLEFIGLLQELDQNLGLLEKEHIFLLMKSEVIKNVLEHKFPQVRQFDVTNLLVTGLEKDFIEKQRYLNPFSQWIWKAILAELRHRRQLGLISDKSFNPRNFEGSKQQEALRFERYLTYLLPWIDRMDSLTPTQFNELSKQASWQVLRRLNDRSVLFKRYATTAAGDTKVTLFNIPQRLLEITPTDIKKIKSQDEEPTLKEQAEKAREEASQQLQKITPDDMSPLSDEVIKEIEEKTP